MPEWKGTNREEGKVEGGRGRKIKRMQAGRKEPKEGRKRRGNLPKNLKQEVGKLGMGLPWEQSAILAEQSVCGAILAEQSACMIRRGPQHTMQWTWGGEICSFPPQGRRTVWVSYKSGMERRNGMEKWDGT
jgi:hypothetical protein